MKCPWEKILTLHYIINTALYHQRCIISSTLYYIINAVLYHQRCIILSTLYYIINAVLYHQRSIISSTINCIINNALYHQPCITMPTLNCIINAALQQQHRSLPLTLYYTVNAVLKKWSNASLNFIQGLQSYITKFCPTSNSILSGSPRHEFETLRLKRCRTSEAVIQKCCPKTLFWETSKNLHFSGKLHEILKKAYAIKFLRAFWSASVI